MNHLQIKQTLPRQEGPHKMSHPYHHWLAFNGSSGSSPRGRVVFGGLQRLVRISADGKQMTEIVGCFVLVCLNPQCDKVHQ